MKLIITISKDKYCYIQGLKQGNTDYATTRMLYHAVKHGKPYLERGKWIPVSERLPEPYRQVLRTVKSIGWNGTFSIYVDIGTICPIDTDVIAWMPLPVPMIPEPYKAESED